MIGEINKILCQANSENCVCLVKLPWSHQTGSAVYTFHEDRETCGKQPINLVVSQDRWSLMTGRINRILKRLRQANNDIYMCVVSLITVHPGGIKD